MDAESFVEFVVTVCKQGPGERGGKRQPLCHTPATVLSCAANEDMSQPPRVLRVVVLVLTMTLNSPTDSSSIFEDGKLKPGIYKIQNLYSRTYLDILEHSRQMCCRPAQNLEEGNGLVRPFFWSVVRRSDNHKWKVMPLGAGYSVQRVRVDVNQRHSPLCAERRKA